MALGMGAWAQHPARSDAGNVTILNHSSSSAADTIIEKVFVENAPKAYNAPAVPSFAIEGKKGRFYLGLGAWPRLLSVTIGAALLTMPLTSPPRQSLCIR